MAHAAASGEFDRVFGLLVSLNERGLLYIALAPPYSVSFEVDPTMLGDELGRTDLDEPTFRRFSKRISSFLAAVLDESQDELVEHLMADQRSGDQISEDDLRRDLARVADAFTNEHIRRRYAIKASSKAPSFFSLDWDIKVKVADAGDPNLEPFPYATCRIAYQTKFDSAPWDLLRAFETAQINFTVDEVDHVLEVYTRIREQLTFAEKQWAERR